MTQTNSGLTFNNVSQKHWYARKGPFKVFGADVDTREKFTDQEAIARFDKIWSDGLAAAVAVGDEVSADAALELIPGNARSFLDRNRAHVQFRFEACAFIAQKFGSVVDQLWVIPSSLGDPRTLYVRFETVDAKRRYEQAARTLEQFPEVLALKLLSDFTAIILAAPHSLEPTHEDE